MIVDTFYPPADASDFQDYRSFENLSDHAADHASASSRSTVVDFPRNESLSPSATDAPATVTRGAGSALVAVAAAGILLGMALTRPH